MHAGADALALELLGRRDRLVDGDAAGDDRDVVAVAHHAAAADRDVLVGRRAHLGLAAQRAQVRDALAVGHRGDQLRRLVGVGRVQHAVEPWIARNDAKSSSAICDGPSSPIETPACEPESRMLAREIAAMRTKS